MREQQPAYREWRGRSADSSCNKRSVTINFAEPEGAALVRRLLAHADVLIENFKVGGLAEYGLGYERFAPNTHSSCTAPSRATGKTVPTRRGRGMT